jgi:DNA invertase Pin-like site-specific DNA recombinase
MTLCYNLKVPKAPKSRSRTVGVVGYCRVSTEEQAISGLGLKAQERAIRAECKYRGLDLVAMHTDAGVSGKSLTRPGLGAALTELDNGRGSVLMVSKLDRLSRNVHDATGLLQRAGAAGWDLVALDAPVDTTTPQGAAMAQVLAVFAELERRLIGERTKAALAVKRSEGIRLGRPPALPDTVRRRILNDHSDGKTLAAIARALNEEGVDTAQGGKSWYPATIRHIVRAQQSTEISA